MRRRKNNRKKVTLIRIYFEPRSGSTFSKDGSEDPDPLSRKGGSQDPDPVPRQNEMDPQHCLKVRVNCKGA